MTPVRRRLLAAALSAAAIACSRAETRADTTSPASNASAAAMVTPEGGLAAATGAPRDSITDRADRGRITGNPKAAIWVIMLSDFQCPYCKQWHDASFAKVMEYANAGKIQLAFINLPLNIHPNAIPAAEAAMCASVQNKFWPMHDALFATQDQWAPLPDPTAKLESVASTLPGIDIASWRTCMTKHQTRPLVDADHDRARSAGANSTPAFIVDGKMVLNPDGSAPGAGANVAAAIEAALKTKP
jgi:protein-disulfide isomerase